MIMGVLGRLTCSEEMCLRKTDQNFKNQVNFAMHSSYKEHKACVLTLSIVH